MRYDSISDVNVRAIRDEWRMTVITFDEWVNLPAQAEYTWQYIGGEVIQVPSNPYVSMISA